MCFNFLSEKLGTVHFGALSLSAHSVTITGIRRVSICLISGELAHLVLVFSLHGIREIAYFLTCIVFVYYSSFLASVLWHRATLVNLNTKLIILVILHSYIHQKFKACFSSDYSNSDLIHIGSRCGDLQKCFPKDNKHLFRWSLDGHVSS